MTLNTLERKNIMSIKREVELYVDEVQLAGQHPAVVILDDDDDDISEMTETDMLATVIVIPPNYPPPSRLPKGKSNREFVRDVTCSPIAVTTACKSISSPNNKSDKSRCVGCWRRGRSPGFSRALFNVFGQIR
jgi:hypothetical protein